MIKSSLLAISLTVVFATIYYVNGENWLVQVGGAVGKNVYVPASFDANVGDTVTFQFVDGIHNVIQADEFATCAKSKVADPFFTPKFPGNAATPPQAVWGPLPKVGKLFYFCDIADHCVVGKMFGAVNVLAAGEPLVEAGVPGPAAPVEPAAAPAPSTPVQPPAPADDLPNQPYVPPATPASPSKSPTSAPPTPLSESSANTYKQISITVMGSTLLSSLAGYFLFL